MDTDFGRSPMRYADGRNGETLCSASATCKAGRRPGFGPEKIHHQDTKSTKKHQEPERRVAQRPSW
jgi:hypothetical protein